MASGDRVGLELCDIPDFTVAQPPRKLRLQHVVRAGRTTAQMSFRYIFHYESKLAKQFFRRARDFLTVLERPAPIITSPKPTPAPRDPHSHPSHTPSDL